MSGSEKYSLDMYNAITARDFFKKVGYGYMERLARDCIEDINLEYTKEMKRQSTRQSTKQFNNA